MGLVQTRSIGATSNGFTIKRMKLNSYLSGGLMTASNNEDSFHLERFVEAQKDIYYTALSELRAGRKQSHWMWFVFPQIDGLGSSPTASYSIKTIAEAQAYLNHSVLGPRLQECTKALLHINGSSASDIFGYPDDLKFCSSMTLFDYVASESCLFGEAIAKYCGGIEIVRRCPSCMRTRPNNPVNKDASRRRASAYSLQRSRIGGAQ